MASCQKRQMPINTSHRFSTWRGVACLTYISIEAEARNRDVLRTGINPNNFAARTRANKTIILPLHPLHVRCTQHATQIRVLTVHFLHTHIAYQHM